VASTDMTRPFMTL